MRKEIEERLIRFSVNVINLRKSLESCETSAHLYNQAMRSATSAALNYGEALGAESRKDFTHKIGIVLKELRESYNNLRIISKSGLYKDDEATLSQAIAECNELISIFYKTARTLKNKA